MSKQANKTLIGAFVLGAIALTVAAVLFFGSGRLLARRYPYVMYFDGSVQGLSVGAPVVLKGARVGSVTDIKVRLEGEEMAVRIPVFIELEPERISRPTGIPSFRPSVDEKQVRERIDALIQHGLRAQLGLQSLVTGQLMVKLDFHPEKPVKLVGIEPEYPEFPTIPSPTEEIISKLEALPLQELVNKLTSAIEGIERTINSPKLAESLDSFNRSLATIRDLVQKIDNRMDPIVTGIDQTVKDARRLVQNIDRQIDPMISGIGQTMADTRELVSRIDGQIDPMISDIRSFFEDARSGLDQARETLTAIQSLTGEDSRFGYNINKSLEELAAAAQSVHELSEYLEQHPDALLRGRGRIGGP